VSKGSGVSIEDLRVEVPSAFVNTEGIGIAAPMATISDAHVQSAGGSGTEAVFVDSTGSNAEILDSRVRMLATLPAVKIFAPGVTIADSDVLSVKGQALDTEFSGTEARILRSRLEGGSTVVTVRTAEVVIDSSLILGGSVGLEVFSNSGVRQAILSNDTIDAGAPKVEDGETTAKARAEGGATAAVTLVNSIAMERQEVEGSATASVTCTTSMVNLQVETNSAGTVSCGAEGDNAFAPVSSLFVAGNDWHLQPGSPAVDSGAGGDSLSGTDLDGAPRIVDGNGDGAATIDRGAYELPVQPPQAAVTAPVAPTMLTALPSNAFKFHKLNRNQRSGTAKLQVEVPGPGRVVLFGKKVKKFIRDAKGAGTFNLQVIPKAALARTLRSAETARTSVQVKFTPTGGTANTRSKALKLIRR